MRLYEFANAEEQLALLRKIIDNTWTAIAQQAAEQQRAAAQRKAQAKLKPRGKKPSKGTSIRVRTPKPPPPKKPLTATTQQPPSPLNKPNPSATKVLNPLPSTKLQLKPQFTNAQINPKATSYSQPKSANTASNRPSFGLKDVYFGKN